MKYIFRKKWLGVAVALFDAGGSLLLLPGRLLKPRMQPVVPPKNILIVRMDHIGDVFFATAVPKAIKRAYPSCKIIFLTSGTAADLLKNNSSVDEVLTYDAAWFGNNRSSRAHKSFLSLAGELKRKNIDTAISLRGDLRENLLLFMAGIPSRIGYGITGGGFLLTECVSYDQNAHELDHAKHLLAKIGVTAFDSSPVLAISAAERDSLLTKIKKLAADMSRSYAVLQVDAGASSKEWSVENAGRFASLYLGQNPENQLILVGQNTERAGLIQRGTPHRTLNLAGQLTLREMAVLAEKASVFIGHDSGPTHLAASTGVRTIYLFSGTNDWERWKPLFRNAVVLRETVSCSPCYLRECPVSGHPCMNRITPEALMRIVQEKAAV